MALCPLALLPWKRIEYKCMFPNKENVKFVQDCSSAYEQNYDDFNVNDKKVRIS